MKDKQPTKLRQEDVDFIANVTKDLKGPLPPFKGFSLGSTFIEDRGNLSDDEYLRKQAEEKIRKKY